ncbi:MAG: nicotinate (nicotinamide) nucleotide adenylyltransferase [Christensenellaceae bacterium]|nr:nicotinate (nicotinamide) nucleotide adenylyltransferase [Christensenellaceae bacterium]MDD6926617.1 nicotinate (nicotinamide) nucleotide adenylyltransferase [bacterium]MDY2851417.1 nicotinate (nicotinamide) nucleotide adenylyltransferase [Christensenellaceae bacterium]
MKILLFGGTFDPVHNEHVKLVKGGIKELSPDKVVIIPALVPPHKSAASVGAHDRLNMAELAFSFDKKIEVSDIEIKRGGQSYTYLTATYFRELYPDAEIFFLIGGDSFFDFDKWVHPEIIAEKCKIVVVSRGEFTEKLVTRNSEFEKKYGYKAKILSFNGDFTSSTYIRYCLMLGCGAENLPESVSAYIEKNGLYKGDKYFEYLHEHLKEKRLYHTAGVIEYGLLINKQLKLDHDKVVLACALHDVAKYMHEEDFKGFVRPEGMSDSVVHAFLGEYVAKNVLGVTDEEVLSAIRYHTTGKADMSPLEKLVYTADLLERNRTYPGVAKLRKSVEENFEKGFAECVCQGYKHLKQAMISSNVYYLTKEAYDFYKSER